MPSSAEEHVLAKIGEQTGSGFADHGLLGRKVGDIGLDSLDLMELLNEIEEHFDIRVEDDTISAETTVAELVAFIDSRRGGREARPG